MLVKREPRGTFRVDVNPNRRGTPRVPANREPIFTAEYAKRQMFGFVQLFYNQERRHSTAGNVSPAQFERRARTTHVA